MDGDQLAAAVRSDPGLKARFAAVSSLAEAVGLATELGYQVTAEELTAMARGMGAAELSDDELGRVAGGVIEDDRPTVEVFATYTR